MSKYVEYVVEKKGIGETAYFITSKPEGDGWIAGFFPSYMIPDREDDDPEMIFQLANPDHTLTGATQDEAEQNIRDWVEAHYKIVERRTERRWS